jgi:hypothetical protein
MLESGIIHPHNNCAMTEIIEGGHKVTHSQYSHCDLYNYYFNSKGDDNSSNNNNNRIDNNNVSNSHYSAWKRCWDHLEIDTTTVDVDSDNERHSQKRLHTSNMLLSDDDDDSGGGDDNCFYFKQRRQRRHQPNHILLSLDDMTVIESAFELARKLYSRSSHCNTIHDHSSAITAPTNNINIATNDNFCAINTNKTLTKSLSAIRNQLNGIAIRLGIVGAVHIIHWIDLLHAIETHYNYYKAQYAPHSLPLSTLYDSFI